MTFAKAYELVEIRKPILQQKKRKVLISLGATDIKIGTPLQDMRRDFTKLFLRCEELGLKPLITTVLCFDTPVIKAKADIFNEFLIESFENVIDMREVLRSGMSGVMTTLNKK